MFHDHTKQMMIQLCMHVRAHVCVHLVFWKVVFFFLNSQQAYPGINIMSVFSIPFGDEFLGQQYC
jgi:hypothetical protein